MRLAVPDLISNSYFPAIAAIDLGCFASEGLDLELDLIFPVDRAYRELRDGTVDLVAGSAHSALAAFPDWDGVKLLCAQAQGMYWFLVMRADLPQPPKPLDIVKGRSIGAAPWVDMGLKALLDHHGYDLARDEITIGPVPRAEGADSTVNFGLMAAKALEEGLIDGFWANGMGTEVAVRSGFGRVIHDTRRVGPNRAPFHYTLASIAARTDALSEDPHFGTKVVRVMNATHRELKRDPQLAFTVAQKRFPAEQAKLIVDLIQRDLPFYSTQIPSETLRGMTGFMRSVGEQQNDVETDQLTDAQSRTQWQ